MDDDPLGPVVLAPDETWLEYTAADGRRRVAFHDYAALYREPGLYERVFYDELGMRSTTEVVAAYGRVLTELGRAPADERVLDLGAGGGKGGELIRALGVTHVVGLDLEPAAREAAERDRPGTYREYLVGDLLDPGARGLDGLREHRFTALLALAAIGVGHVPPAALRRALDLVEPGGLFAFAVTPALLPGSTDPAGIDSGYPEFIATLFADAEELSRTEYVHRRQADGTPHDAVAFVGRLPG